jgi:hypothetical protein
MLALTSQTSHGQTIHELALKTMKAQFAHGKRKNLFGKLPLIALDHHLCFGHLTL